MQTELLTFAGVCKAYGSHVVLHDVSLTVAAGECVCLVGENGCGKSTLLRIAAGLTRADKGCVVRAKGRSLQYVPDQFPALSMTGTAFLRYLSRIDCDLQSEIIRRFRMEPYLCQSIQGYSKGMRGKLGVLQALLAHPDILLLDEPISGQDAEAREIFVECVRRLTRTGAAVVMACHERDLIDALSTRVLRIAAGTLVHASGGLCGANLCLCRECALFHRNECAGRGEHHA